MEGRSGLPAVWKAESMAGLRDAYWCEVRGQEAQRLPGTELQAQLFVSGAGAVLEFPGSLDQPSANGPLTPSFPKKISSQRF